MPTAPPGGPGLNRPPDGAWGFLPTPFPIPFPLRFGGNSPLQGHRERCAAGVEISCPSTAAKQKELEAQNTTGGDLMPPPLHFLRTVTPKRNQNAADLGRFLVYFVLKNNKSRKKSRGEADGFIPLFNEEQSPRSAFRCGGGTALSFLLISAGPLRADTGPGPPRCAPRLRERPRRYSRPHRNEPTPTPSGISFPGIQIQKKPHLIHPQNMWVFFFPPFLRFLLFFINIPPKRIVFSPKYTSFPLEFIILFPRRHHFSPLRTAAGRVPEPCAVPPSPRCHSRVPQTHPLSLLLSPPSLPPRL